MTAKDQFDATVADVRQPVGQRLRELRLACGVSLDQAATSVGLHPNSVLAYERGRWHPPEAVVRGLLLAYQARTNYLTGLEHAQIDERDRHRRWQRIGEHWRRWCVAAGCPCAVLFREFLELYYATCAPWAAEGWKVVSCVGTKRS